MTTNVPHGMLGGIWGHGWGEDGHGTLGGGGGHDGTPSGTCGGWVGRGGNRGDGCGVVGEASGGEGKGEHGDGAPGKGERGKGGAGSDGLGGWHGGILGNMFKSGAKGSRAGGDGATSCSTLYVMDPIIITFTPSA